tara:strand:- start:31 stop:492 length:462 start_codon:yes stop_codon:yes gene_type:complete
MNKYIKIFAITFLLILNNCGYNPIFTNNSIEDFKIVKLELKGDKIFGNKIYQELKPYMETNSQKEYNLVINTSFTKVTIAKDSTGDPSNFNMIANVSIELSHKNIKETLFFTENLKIKSKDNSFEQREYENMIKDDFAKIIKEKLITKIQLLK